MKNKLEAICDNFYREYELAKAMRDRELKELDDEIKILSSKTFNKSSPESEFVYKFQIRDFIPFVGQDHYEERNNTVDDWSNRELYGVTQKCTDSRARARQIGLGPYNFATVYIGGFSLMFGGMYGFFSLLNYIHPIKH